MVSINVYPAKEKFVVQSGARNPERLIDWLSRYGTRRDMLSINVCANTENEDDERVVTVPQTDVVH